jgi:signal transduction histidine kinase
VNWTDRLRLSLRARTEAWADGFDPSMRSGRFWGRVVVASSVALAVLIPFLAYAPGVRSVFRLQPAVPLALVALRLAILQLTQRYERRHGPSAVFFAVSALDMAFLFQWIVSSMVVWSEPPGAFVLASLPVVSAAYNGLILRPTLRFPFPLLAHAAAIAAAWALRPGIAHEHIFLAIVPLALGSCLVLGALGERLARQQATLERHRRAIEAQTLEERTLEARRLASELFELLERNHDASSSLSTALLDADLLVERAETGGAGGGPGADAGAAHALRDDLGRLARILEERPVGASSAEDEEAPFPTPVMAAVRAALSEAALRFPGVATSARAVGAEAEAAAVALRGGPEKLGSLLAGLVINACEGRGARGAGSVDVVVEWDEPTGDVSIQVRDDGPGFPDEVLAAPVTAFVTTKPRGSGLGLYTAERLVSASGGSLRRENAPGGGAVVTVVLAAARPAARPPASQPAGG